jgi:arylsulfatase
VSDEYDEATSRFPGTVHWVQIDVGAEDDDHLISPDERWRVSMARQ